MDLTDLSFTGLLLDLIGFMILAWLVFRRNRRTLVADVDAASERARTRIGIVGLVFLVAGLLLHLISR